ncbi:fumarate reductase/succinate dehydrogenase flavoprotein subunit [Nocardia cyriacigeorgica]|uniref:fumarate reductase/succinate dehydrogenase flavoprotein subunit n=1 Tax=Nocardia cyriacigeorgica TaxID=135487 RepID=UPI0002E3A57D|nr:fumarate reductase/succinate dehydrogenase flavoprotein subunit [Nocardia cyriacigeorgica]MBF6498107.1 fumarate reductase/succinate dehydrogenase flavoprotein subunit [Nocardia cyriacigeorgica]TLF60227.1 fumarate reductase/succinate dehydrogenase flavoprotein subunit [Nocardia cyriacigeorgica]
MTAPTLLAAPDLADAIRLDCDVLVIGGGTAGTMAALTAAEQGANVLLLEKAHVRHSGALAMGMDGVNNAVIPGKAEPEDYVAEITRANDGIVDQRTVYQTATRGFAMVQRLESYGVKFEKDEYGEYAVRRVHRSGSYVLPMPEGKDVKKALYRVLRQRKMRERIRIENRLMPVRVLTDGGRAVGAAALNTRTGEFVAVGAKAVILATGPCGRLGLPASGYLYGTYENPTNAGDGYSMAYHAGAELSGIECFQINPLIKDYNGPACAYVANPFGGYQVNAEGERFVDSDYWSGQMMSEVKREIESARGPIYLKVSHLPEETLSTLEGILHTTERPTRGTFHANRGHDYRTHDIEMHISEIGLCSGHSASGVWVDENARTTVPGLYAAGDLACVPHNYMIGAFVFGDLAGAHAASTLTDVAAPQQLPQDQLAEAHELIYRPLRHPDGPPQPQVEYKLRRFVNDYVAPPKTAAKLSIAVETFERMRGEIAEMGARTPHELMRAVEVSFIRDCAEMAARSSLTRTESRWGLYHERADLPERDDVGWRYHLNLRKNAEGGMEFLKRPVAPYLVPVPGLDDLPSAEAAIELVEQPELIARRAPSAETVVAVDKEPAAPPSPRLVTLLGLDSPSVAQLSEYLSDADPVVRVAALSVLTEHTPDGFAGALIAALDDSAASVRAAAAAGLRELVEVLPSAEGLAQRLRSPDPVVRATVVDLLRALRAGTAAQFGAALADSDHRVRIEAVRALVSLDDGSAVAALAGDPNREVRIAVAQGLATIGTGAEAIRALASDRDPLVRAAAFAAYAALGTDTDSAAELVAALGHSAWQVRVGAARGLAGADPESALPALTEALSDPHLDVRKAAVLALSGWAGLDSARIALKHAVDDPDADVRAYARRALAG